MATTTTAPAAASTPEPGGIEIYINPDNSVEIQVLTDSDTVWLNRSQLGLLFGRDYKTISKHIKNALSEELDGIAVVAKFATTAADKKTYYVEHFNIDMIMSVGFRVKSKEGIHFRRWANRILQNYLVKGYSENKQRLKAINKTLNILSRSSESVIAGIADVLQNFASGLTMLDNYDHQLLIKPNGNSTSWELTYTEARAFIDSMRFAETSDLFGNERDDSFKSTLGAIYQTFDGKDLYPSTQEKAANLLYLIVKNHSFSDGNKRIAAALFVYFLDQNGALKDKQGQLIIANNTLAAITLMIALSDPSEKDIMCLLVMNMLEQ